MSPLSIDHRDRCAWPISNATGLRSFPISVALGEALLFQRLYFGDAAVPLLLFAGAISSWYGGPGPSVLAVILSLIGFDYFFVPPLHTFIALVVLDYMMPGINGDVAAERMKQSSPPSRSCDFLHTWNCREKRWPSWTSTSPNASDPVAKLNAIAQLLSRAALQSKATA